MKSRQRAGFSAIDLVVVIGIIGFLFSVMLPAVQNAEEASKRMKSANNMKVLALAAHGYHDTNRCFVPGVDANGFSAVAYLLPYIEQGPLYERMKFKIPISDPANAAARQTAIKLLIDPSDVAELAATPGYAPTNYLFCAGSKPSLENNNGIFYRDSKVGIREIRDGTSNTLLIGATLRGDNGKKAVDVQRQHVVLKGEKALQNLNDEAGVKDFQNN